MTHRARISVVTTVVALLLAAFAAGDAQAACCRASCIGPIPWKACFADTTSCNMLQCVGGASTTLAVDAAGTCGVGGVFGDCPPNEIGACNDNINNDGWVDAVTDAADPDCAAAAAPAGVPAVGALGVVAIVVLLVVVARRRFRRSTAG